MYKSTWHRTKEYISYIWIERGHTKDRPNFSSPSYLLKILHFCNNFLGLLTSMCYTIFPYEMSTILHILCMHEI